MKSLTLLRSLLLGAALCLAGLPGRAGDTVTLANADLAITWRTRDAAVVQVAWRGDGTRLLPETGPGLGAAAGAAFTEPPVFAQTARGREIAFGGGRVVYRLPDQGHVLELVSASVPLALLPAPGPFPGRVFTVEDRRIHAVAWTDIVKDPFFAFMGARRKELPPATRRLGMDLGGPNPAFAALWEVAAEPERGGGYVLAPGGAGRLYLGPRREADLAAFGQPFTRVLDFGFFGPVGKALYGILHLLHRLGPGWGWTLVLFAAVLRLVLWPLNTRTIVQGLRARDLDPHLKALQARLKKAGGTLAEQQAAVAAFHRKNGHSPLGGCLPSLVQMPVFLGLYGMLGNVFELRNAPWLFWIRDLAGKDPFFVLPILLGLSMFAQQALAPPPGDAAQGRLMQVLMPVMMVVMFANLPAGLNLFYLAFNLGGLAQTWWVARGYRPQPVLA